MITQEEFSILLQEDVQQAIHNNRNKDPFEIALSKSVPHARLVASEVKYLQKAQTKLPHYAAHECIIPSRAYEQSSSEECALHKPLEGHRLLDLTCGLGVDAWYLSQRFDEVVTLERDALLAKVAKENFRRLGAKNIRVINSSAEDFVNSSHEQFDWVYADPDRRGKDGRKKVCLEDCSPNMIDLMPRLREIAPKVCIKNSPLFDIDEAKRLFEDARVEVLSLAGECKEVVIYLDGTPSTLTATALGEGSYTAPSSDLMPQYAPTFQREAYHWLVIPDVALQKSRLVAHHLLKKADVFSENGFGFATEMPHDILGRVMEIDHIEKYDPRSLKRQYKGMGAEIYKRDFPLQIEEVMRRVGLHAGREIRLALTKIGHDYWVIRLK